MAIFSFLGKRDVPDELPNLVTDDIGKNLTRNPELDKEVIKAHLSQEIVQGVSLPVTPVVTPSILPSTSSTQPPLPEQKPTASSDGLRNNDIFREGFFDDMQKDINKEINDLDQLQDWYENKFLPKDVVSGMREYWESQKPASVLKILGRNFKENLNARILKLQNLEKEWQDIYFDLIQKEEAIKDEEKELKKILAEFVSVYKKKNTEISSLSENSDSKKEYKKQRK